jgi:RNA polymerase sigma-70 factor (ECF subfamily)
VSEEARWAAAKAAERSARLSYGRLVAILASRTGDITGAEDALADAFAAALRTWPDAGVPDSPDAWLLIAARRNTGHARARAATATADERAAEGPVPFGDARLKLMFACAHPAIDQAAQAPLMLQAVLGLDAARIAACFLISPAAMGKALTRAKTKIRDAGIAFAVPEPERLSDRLETVLSAIYAAYGTGWEDVTGADAKRRGLTEEAIWLARLVVDLLPETPEATGLLALMLYCEARAATRRDAGGGFVPLRAQDPARWSRPMVIEAEALLRAAARYRKPGRFQTEAAIQSLHAQSVMTGEDLSPALVRLYDLLVTFTPSLGAYVARASAYAEAGEAGVALRQLDGIDKRGYQPWWAARARTLHLLGRQADAKDAAATAAGLSTDPAIREYLLSGGLFAGKLRS